MYIHIHNTYILYIHFVTLSNIVLKWCTTDIIPVEINPVIVIKLLEALSSESGYLVTYLPSTPHPALMSW